MLSSGGKVWLSVVAAVIGFVSKTGGCVCPEF